MIPRHPRTTRTDTLCPYTTLFLSNDGNEPSGTLAAQPGCRKAKIRDMDSAQPSRHSCHAGTTTKDNQRLPSDQNARFSASARSVLSQVKKSLLAFRPKRSEERRVGKECVRQFRSRWAQNL